MFALKPRLEVTTRVLLIAVVLFNALVPTTSAVQAKQQEISLQPSPIHKVEQVNRTIPIFDRPNLGIEQPESDEIAWQQETNLAANIKVDSSFMFVENMGQFDPKVRFVAKTNDFTVFFTENDIWFSLLEPRAKNNAKNFLEDLGTDRFLDVEDGLRKRVNLKFDFIGAQPGAQIEPSGKINVNVSYLTGNSKDNWRSNVPVWSQLKYDNIYPGVNLEISAQEKNLIWNFVIVDQDLFSSWQSQNDQRNIRLKIAGQNKIQTQQRNLKIETSVATILSPVFLVNGVDVTPEIKAGGEFVVPIPTQLPMSNLNSLYHTVGYESSPVVPALLAQGSSHNSILLGGLLDWDWGSGIAVGEDGAIYVVGTTLSADFPTKPGSYDTSYGGISDAFVVKLDPITMTPVYATFLGGSLKDDTAAISVDQDGAAYISGCTESSDFPTLNAYDPTFNGPVNSSGIHTCTDGFITVLNPAGSSLLYSSFLGDSPNWDWLNGSVIDSNGTFHVITASRADPSFGPITYGILKIHPDGTAPIYTHSFGNNRLRGIAVRNDGYSYVSGDNGADQVFAASLTETGSPNYSVSFGGSGVDIGFGVSVDELGNAYVTGRTTSVTSFPTTPGALRTQISGGQLQDAFVTRLDPTGAISYSTLLGGDLADIGFSVAIDQYGNLFVVGLTPGSNFPVTAGSISPDPDGWNIDAFAVVLTPTNLDHYDLVYGTYIGGSTLAPYDSGDENLFSFIGTIDSQSNVYVTGSTDSPDFVSTAGVADGDEQAFVVKISTSLSQAVPIQSITSPSSGDACFGIAYNGTQGIKGKPINTQIGAYEYTVSDLSISTSAGELAFQREYTSLSTDNPSPLSPGWTHNHDTRLIFPADPEGQPDTILFKAHTANKYLFTINGDGTYTPYPGLCATLVNQAGSYILKDGGQKTYTFNSSGELTSIADAQGHLWDYAYDTTSGKLGRINADGGSRYLSLRYDSNGRIDRVSDHTGRFVTYHYDDISGDLDYAVDLLGQTWTYQYSSHLLTRVAAPGNVTGERTEYDSQGRAWRQFGPDADGDGQDDLIVELTYNADGTTNVKDALNNTEIHTYDERGTLTAQTNGAGGEQSKHYDPNFRPDVITDSLSNPTKLTWSSDGVNLTHIEDAGHNHTNIDYGNYNNPTKIVDPLGNQTIYEYTNLDFPTLPTLIKLLDSNNNLLSSTSYAYYPLSSGAARGKAQLITDASGYKTHYTYTSSGQTDVVIRGYQSASPQTTDYDYDNVGNLIKVIGSDGMISLNQYDDAGRLVVTIGNVIDPYDNDPPQNQVSADGERIYNQYTRYYYDTRGNQIAVADTNWTITRTYYDLANRPVTVVQNLVIGSMPATSDAQARTAINTPLGTVPGYDSAHPDWNIRNDIEYDEAGNVIVTRDPASVITRTYYDGANRPKLVIQNWSGADLYGSILTAPSYDPAFPDQNVRTESSYDDNNNLIATKDTLGIITRIYYDELNRPKTVVQHLTGQDIIVTTIPDRGTSSNIRTDTHYDANGNVIATVDPNGITTRTYYDSLNRPVAVVQNLVGKSYTDPTLPDPGQGQCGTEANICSFTYYDQTGNAIATVDPTGVVTRTYYDEANRPSIIVANLIGDIYAGAPPRGDGSSDQNVRTDIAYDADGRRDTTTDPMGRVTKYTYNDIGQLVSVTANYVNGGLPQNDQDQRNIVTEYTYDALGRQKSVMDTMGRTTRNEYDALGRVLKTTQNYLSGADQNYKDPVTGDQFNLVTTYTYDVAGNQIAVKDTKDVITRTYYDGLSRPLTIIRNLIGQGVLSPVPPGRSNPPNPLMNVRMDTAYLGTGSVDFTLDQMGQKTDYEYDPLNRLTTVLDPLFNTTIYEYDANGNRTIMTDAEGTATKFEYNALNYLEAVVENDQSGVAPDHQTNVRTEYIYDARGNRLSILDGNQHSTFFTYTALGLLKTEADALGNMSTYNYNAIGNRTSLLDANNKTTLYEYDELNRLDLIDYPNPDADVTFAYDALGRRLAMMDGTGTTSWSYTNIDLPNQITDPFGTGVSYEYDALGNRTELIYDNQSAVYTYDALNRLSEVRGSGLSNKVEYGYYASGHIKQVSRPNGVNTLYHYYDNGWLQDITHSSGSAILASYEYEYYNNGNRRQAKENIQFPSPFPTATPTGVPTTVTPSESPSLTPTTGSTATATTTPTVTFTPTLTPTSPSNDLIFADGFESANLSAWTSTSTDAGDLSVSTLAAIKGSQGMQALIDDTTAIFVTDDTPNAEPRYRMRFYFDPNSFTMANGDAHIIFRGIEGSSTIVLRVEFGFSSGAYQIRAGVVNDGSTWTDTNWVTISDTSHSIEMDWRAATAIGANDGGLTMWIDGTQQANLTGIDNDTRRVDRARLGALASIDAGTSGTSYFDTFESRRNSYIGPLAQVPSGQYAYTSFVQPTQQADFSRLPLSFVANVGQFDKAVQFQTNSLGGSIYFTSSDVVLALMDKKMKLKSAEDDSLSLKDNSKIVSIQYKNARKDGLVQGLNLLPGVANFMLGTDKKAWVANAPTYDGIVYSDIYPGIDLTYQGAGNSLKSTFVVAPGMDPATIQWSYKDAGNISLAADGNLIITLPAKKAEQTDTTLIEHAPVAWQEPDGQRVDVAVQYAVSNKGDISFIFPEGYDASLPLTIDPTLTYSTYLGDIGTDVGTAITSDSTGNVYVTGYSWCGDFPLVDPIPQGSYVESEIIISKISADGSTLLYSTCVGGSGDEIGTSVALDTQGRIVVGGATDSADFPIVGGIATYGGNTGICNVDAPCQDSFILALNEDGSAIRYSTYLGGDGREELGGVAVDANGKVLVVGSTTSTNFPTVNAYDNSFATGGTCSSSVPCYDITVTKIDPELSGMSAILYSTYLGANNRDIGYGLALDSSGRVYLTGLSQSDGYPTRNAMQATRKGDRDIVVTVIDPSLSADASLLYSTYFGSADFEAAYGIARDSNGNVYLTGRTQSSKFPLRDPLQYTSHASSTCGGSVCSEAFVTKLNLSTNTIVYSTYLGGSQDDAGHGIALDSYGRAYVTGYTRSSDFHILNALQATKGADGCSVPPCADAFLSVLEPDGQAFAYSTFLGGDQNDFANGIVRDADNNIYLVGETYSTNFPTTPGAYDVINAQTDKRDAFIAKVSALGTPAAQSYSHLDVQVSASSDDAEESASGSSVNLTSLDLELTQTSSNQKIGIRFANFEIPEGAIIQNAWIQFTSSAANAEVTNLTIQAQASDNAPTFVASANNISSRAKTTASVSWSPDVWNADEGGPNQRTPNLASVLQEVTNRPGWAPGNGLAIILTGTANSKRIAKAYDRDIFGAPYLHIEYTLETLPTPTFTPTLTQTGTATATAILTATDTPTVTSTTTATPIGTPTLTATFGPSPTPMPSGLTTILYEYDALNRLTRADYSGGDYYHYTYDSVGNRLTQDILLGGLPSNTTYVYDDANRLTSVDGLTHTWDDNGNLRSDGLNTYTYDSANRLKTLTGPSISAVYEYNGLGDRLRQTLDGQTTTFTMDLNTGLTQALSDGTNTYIYGIDRIAQVNTATEYFLGDALGSVRQLTNQSGAITYTRAYDPYGVVTATGGSSQSSFGFTGEFSGDYNELLYLRARYYAPGVGRFLTRDTWRANSILPMSYNKWNYVESNPMNRIDPTGLFSKELIRKSIDPNKFFSEPFSQKEHSHWGFYGLLLFAQDFDTIRAGSLNLLRLHPDVAWSTKKVVWTLNCETIMVGNQTLSQYYDTEIKRQKFPAIWWRDTSPMIYELYSMPTRPFHAFADGLDYGLTSTYPQFRSISAGYGDTEAQLMVDINGAFHLSLSGGIGKIFGRGYAEGYLCTWTGAGCFGNVPSPSDVTKAIDGLCWSNEIVVVAGINISPLCGGPHIFSAGNYGAMSTFYTGLEVGAGTGGSLTLPLSLIGIPSIPTWGWKWALDDQLNGITYKDIIMAVGLP